MPYNFTKTSGVIKITPTGEQPQMFFGVTGKVITLGNNINLTVGEKEFNFPYTDITVNGQVPSSLTTAMTLLNSIFGS
jgi:hypothetical protein